MTTNSKGSEPDRPRRLRRSLRFVAILCLLLVAALVLLPLAASWMAPGLIERIVAGRLNGRATVGELSLSYSGDVQVRDLVILDDQDRPVLSVGQADLSAELWSAVSGRYVANLEIDGFELHVRPGREQPVNLIELPKKTEREEQDRRRDTPGSTPDVRMDLSLKNGRVVIHGLQGRTELRGLSLRVELEGLDRESRFAFGAELFGPGDPNEPAGRLSSEGTFLALSSGREADRVDMTLKIEGLLLEALAPALSLVASAEGIAGRLDASLAGRLTGEHAVVGSGSVTLLDLRIPSTREGAGDLLLGSVALEGVADLDRGGSGQQSIRLAVADLVTLEYVGDLTLDQNGSRSLVGTVQLEGQMERLAEAARAFVPLEAGLTFGGQLSSGARIDLRSEAGGPTGGRFNADCAFPGLTARDASGQPIDLGELANSRFSFDAALDPERGRVNLSELSLHLGPVRVTGQVSLSGLSGLAEGSGEFDPGALRVEPSRFEIEADLDRLARQLEAVADLESLDLAGSLRLSITAEQQQDQIQLGVRLEPRALRAAGLGLEGAPLLGEFSIGRTEGRLSIQGGLRTTDLAFTLKDGSLLSQEDVILDLDLTRTDLGEIRIQQLRYASATATARLTGSASALEDALARQADLEVTLDGQLARILADLGAVLELRGIQGQGDLTSHYRLRQDGSDVTLEGETELDGLRLDIPGKQKGAAPVLLEEPRLLLGLDAALTLGDGGLDLRRLSVDSRTLQGQLQGRLVGLLSGPEPRDGILLEEIQGAFTYIPDRLGVLLAPWLPGELSGSEPEELTLDLSGRLDQLDMMTLLESSKGDLELGLGTFRLPGTTTTGSLSLGLDQGRARLTGDLGANGGTLDLIGDLGRRAEAEQASLSLDLKQFAVNTELGDLLSMLHPSFAIFGDREGDRLEGIVDCKVELAYGRTLSLKELVSDWTSLDPRLIQGDVFFQIEQAAIRGSPLIAEMLEQFGLTKDQELVLSPMRFRLDGGRLIYAEPWKWRLAGIKTLFTGSIGFDRTLDLNWSIPINRRLVKKYGFLEILQGESVEIPLTGTTSAPQLEWSGILAQLARKAAARTLAEETGLGDLGGLGGLLGGQREPAAPEDDPKQLLQQANGLWESGKRRKAAKIYRRLEKEFKLTTVYLFNKDLIKKRADFKRK